MTTTTAKPKLRKYFIRTLLGMLIFILLAVVSGFITIYYNQSKIKQLFVAEINKSLQTEISVKDIEFSVFEKFPNASINFKEVVAKDATKDSLRDTLLTAKNIFLEFNLWDLYYKHYHIKNIELNDATVNIKVDKQGNDNFHFWKSTENQSASKFEFSLQKIKFKNVRVKYINKAVFQYYDFFVDKALAKGDFTNEIQAIKLQGNLQINHFQSEEAVYFSNEKADISLAGNINTQEESIEIQNGDLLLNDLNFDVKGKIYYAFSNKKLEINIKGKNIQLHNFIKELPKEQQLYFCNYESKGIFDFGMEIKGYYGGNHLPLITSNFNFRNGEIFHTKTKARLSNVAFQGSYSNGQDEKTENNYLNIHQFSCNLKNGKINASFVIYNFKNPSISCSVSANLNLEDLQQFIKNNNIATMQGNIVIDFNFKGKINKDALKITDFINSQTIGQASISKFQIKLKNDHRNYTNFNGAFSFTNNDIEINTLCGNISSSDVNIKGYFRNVIPFLFLENQKIEVNADLASKNIDLDEIIGTQQTPTGSNEFRLSDNYIFNLSIAANKIKFKKFKAKSLKGKISYTNHLFKAEQLSMESMDGNINGSMMINGSKNTKFLISCDVNTSNVNAQQLFYVFDNFGQNNMTSDNINGNITANIQFASLFNSYLQVDKKSIWSKINLKIENGKLLNYQPLMKLSRFINVDDLKEVSFKTIQNQILINNETIIIPAMDIQSSAINLGISGEHSFNNIINYRINILLSELSSKKRKQRKQQRLESTQEFGYEEDDGLGRTKLFLKVTGTMDNPIFKYDSKGLKEKLILDLKNEKRNLNNILKEEFKWLQRDSADIIQQQHFKVQEKGKYIINWEEETKEKQKKQTVSDSIPQSKMKIKWDD
ncbi:MAG: hypothetical protein HXX18_00900 [Bacteroidetes bacterium]|nr:hypothetical protein [Bacteroidota bacterium]